MRIFPRKAMLGAPICAAACLMLLHVSPAAAQGPPLDVRVGDMRTKLGRELNQIAASFDGAIGIAVKDFTNGDVLAVNADTIFPQASSIKVAVLIELLRQAQAGTLKLDERVEVRKAQMVGGSGVLANFADGASSLSLHDLAVLMIVLSDNTATNILIDRVGMAKVNDTMAGLRLSQTRLERRMIDLDAERQGRENLSTPREMVTLYDLLFHGKALDEKHTALALEILKIPKDTETTLVHGLPPGVAIANKRGELDGVRCDSGIVLLDGRPYAISVMTTYAADGDAAERTITEISRRVYSYFERQARSNAHGVRLPQ
jgi:beta-lactamase class A